jgi:hypothetical protein
MNFLTVDRARKALLSILLLKCVRNSIGCREAFRKSIKVKDLPSGRVSDSALASLLMLADCPISIAGVVLHISIILHWVMWKSLSDIHFSVPVIFQTDASYRSRHYSFLQARSSAVKFREAMKMRLQPLILMFAGTSRVPVIHRYVSIMLILTMTQVELL